MSAFAAPPKLSVAPARLTACACAPGFFYAAGGLGGRSFGRGNHFLCRCVGRCRACAAVAIYNPQPTLNQPSSTHDAQGVLPDGGLAHAHVYELVRRAERRLLGEAPFSRDVGAVLHCWLFHLCGGLDSKLLPPSEQRSIAWKRAAKLARARAKLEADMRKAQACRRTFSPCTSRCF